MITGIHLNVFSFLEANNLRSVRFIVNNKFCARRLTADGDILIENHCSVPSQRNVCFLFLHPGQETSWKWFICMHGQLSRGRSINQSTNIDCLHCAKHRGD